MKQHAMKQQILIREFSRECFEKIGVSLGMKQDFFFCVCVTFCVLFDLDLNMYHCHLKSQSSCFPPAGASLLRRRKDRGSSGVEEEEGEEVSSYLPI